MSNIPSYLCDNCGKETLGERHYELNLKLWDNKYLKELNHDYCDDCGKQMSELIDQNNKKESGKK